MKTSFKNSLIKFAVIFFTTIILLIIFVNAWISRIVSKPAPITPPVIDTAQKQTIPEAHITAKVMERRTWLDPNREFWESVIISGDKEICRFKNAGEKIFDLTGDIPNAEIKFFNQSENTSGRESFRNGNWHGWFREYYETGKIKRETRYYYGKKMVNKEYFIDGILHMEEDLKDALSPNAHDESGSGKVFTRSGVLKYEWHLTQTDPRRYTKAYDRDGRLMEENIFNERGEKISTRSFPPQ